MPDQGAAGRLSADELADVVAAMRQGLVVAALYLALLLVLPAGLLIVLVDHAVALRLMLLVLVGVLCGLALARAPWCYRLAREHRWVVLLPAGLMAAVIAVGGGHQNATFVVCVAVLCALAVAADLWAGLAAAAIVATGYVAGMVARGQPLLPDGAPGDLEAIVASLMAVYAAYWAADLAEAMVADLNNERRVAESLNLLLRRMLSHRRQPQPSIEDARDAMLHKIVAEGLEGDAAGAEVALPPQLRERGFTDAVWDVAYRSARGMSHAQIATVRGTSTRAVERQVAHARDLLDVKSPPQMAAAVAEAIREVPQAPLRPV